MTVFIYLARPIDKAAPHDRDIERAAYDVHKGLVESRVPLVLFNPAETYQNYHATEPHPAIARVNDQAVRAADGVVALLPPGIPTIGTPMEMEVARHCRIPLFLIGGDDSWHLADHRGIDVRLPWRSRDTEEQISNWIRDLEGRESPPTRRDLLVKTDYEMVPTRSYLDDAGYDLRSREDVRIKPGSYRDIPTGVDAVTMPEGTWGFITGRSSTYRRWDVMVIPGVIDAGYRGPLYVGLRNLGDTDILIERGSRIAQVIPIPMHRGGDYTLEHVAPEDMPETDRGVNGFGSSGRT